MKELRRYRRNLQKSIMSVLKESPQNGKQYKAAVVTWCNNNGPTNFGQILQCYAVQQILLGMGIEPVTVLYQKIPASAPEEDIVRVQRFQEFINKTIAVTKPCLTKKMVEEETEDCDLLVCGSDQIWNPVFYDPIYFLDFGKATQKRMALAVSGIFPSGSKNKEVYQNIPAFLDKLDYVSVRERCGIDILSGYTKKAMDILPDPTLLMTVDEWSSLLHGHRRKESDEEDYALCYFLGNMEDYVDGIRSLSGKHGLSQIKYISSNIVLTPSYSGMKEVRGCGPEEFLRLIRSSKLVITDSFHGVCIAHIFQVPFYYADRMQQGGDVFGGKYRVGTLQTEYDMRIPWLYPDIVPIGEKKKKGGQVRVSVVVAVHNAEKYLGECLDCLTKQTWSNLEIICVDDGSTDNSPDIIRRFQTQDERIRLITQENKYAGVARNNGLLHVTGKYVMFLDADDRFSPSLIEEMTELAVRNFDDIVICESEGFDDEGNGYSIFGNTLDLDKLPEKEVFCRSDIPDDIFRLTGGQAWDKLYHVDFLREHDLSFLDTRVCEDGFFSILAFAEAERISAVRKKLVYYRIHTGTSTWDRRETSWIDVFKMLDLLEKELDHRGILPELKRNFDNVAIGYISVLLMGGVSEYTTYKEIVEYLKGIETAKYHFLEHSEGYFYDKTAYEQIEAVLTNESENGLLKLFNLCTCELTKSLQMTAYYLENVVGYSEMLSRQKMWRLPLDMLPDGSRVAVYGYGDVGRDYCLQIKRDCKLNFAGAYDRNCSKKEQLPYEITLDSPRNIDPKSFDYIIVAIVDGNIADGIIFDLKNKYFVPEEKIIWANPEGNTDK